jgi:hypothetical protein
VSGFMPSLLLTNEPKRSSINAPSESIIPRNVLLAGNPAFDVKGVLSPANNCSNKEIGQKAHNSF